MNCTMFLSRKPIQKGKYDDDGDDDDDNGCDDDDDNEELSQKAKIVDLPIYSRLPERLPFLRRSTTPLTP